jgi:3-oxoacyl-[acyl-carrier-protein] synthase II
MSRRRVVVTGLGVVSPLGSQLDTFLDRLLKGQSGVRRITHYDPTPVHLANRGGSGGVQRRAVRAQKRARRMDPFCHYGLGATRLAVQDSGLDLAKENPTRCGVMMGSGIGGLQIVIEQMDILRTKGPSRFSPFMIPQMITNILAGYVAIEYGLQGPNFCITSACATGTHCLGESMRMIRNNETDIMLAGGAEGAICELGVGGFCAMRALSTRNDDPQKASRPFDKGRDGFVIGEGAGVLVLEELEHAKARGARIYCELSGYGRTCDAYHITAPHEEGAGAGRAITEALADAQINADEINYVNPHATSTLLGDRCETHGHQAGHGRGRGEADRDQRDQVHDRPSAGRRGQRGKRGGGVDVPARDDSSHDQSR